MTRAASNLQRRLVGIGYFPSAPPTTATKKGSQGRGKGAGPSQTGLNERGPWHVLWKVRMGHVESIFKNLLMDGKSIYNTLCLSIQIVGLFKLHGTGNTMVRSIKCIQGNPETAFSKC